ncbi:hypothetical protein HAX54_025875 [Datura stramonium]|uniref:Uncharacterized protein n=1 Tax=Datura stramonium TaxID=4076 RepID=A0ABS8V2B9_DATST|nr:hypothetical protein [Datura stramonium]
MAPLINLGLTMELLLLSTGLISTFFMLKNATSPHCLFDTVREILNSLKSFLSSPLYICLFINSVVILILTFSKFQHPIKKFLNVFLVEKDAAAADISIQPQAHHHEKEDYMPNRTNSAIAMDTVMSFFSRYNSHPLVLEDTIQDEMSCSSVKIDSAQTITTTLLQSQTSWDRIRTKIENAQTTTTTTTLPPQSQTSWDRLRTKIDSVQTTATKTTLPQSQTSWDRPRDKANTAQTTAATSTLPQSQINWDQIRAKTESAQTWHHNFPDISHLTEAREIVNPCSSNPPDHETTTRTNYQENIEEGESEDDSLEATWNAITKKKQDLKKSLTFNDALSMSRIGGLRGDISVSTEESNKKFDDFIKKINHEWILQRQESDQRAINYELTKLS